jgi:type II restriction enzyme
MYKYGVRLVVPKPYLNTFPKEFREKILTVESFVPFLRSKQK